MNISFTNSIKSFYLAVNGFRKLAKNFKEAFYP